MGTSPEIDFRSMTLNDIAAVMEIEQKCFGEDSWNEQFFIHELCDSHSDYIIAEVAGEIIGCGGIKIFLDDAEGMTLAVLPKFQGRGIGKKLFAELIKNAKARGAKSLIFEVRVSNVPALHIYQEFGFKAVGRMKHYYSDSEDALTMSANLEEIQNASNL